MLLCVAAKTHNVPRVLLNVCLHIYNCFINALSRISASHRFQNISFYVTEQEGCTGENWLKDVAVQTKQWDYTLYIPESISPSKMPQGQYPPVNGPGSISPSKCPGANITQYSSSKLGYIQCSSGLFPWKRFVWQHPSQERTNQNVRIYQKSTLHII